MGRLLTLTDIHGCYLTVKAMVEEKLKPTSDDTLIFLGDYCDRGDKVFETVEYMIELSKQYNCIFIKGNHEMMWLDYLKGESRLHDVQMFFYNGGKSTLNSYCANIIDPLDEKPMRPGNGLTFADLPQDHQDFYNNLVVFHEIDEFVFVHAGVNPVFSLEDQEEHDMIWIRDQFLYHPIEPLVDRVVVHGHTPMERYELAQYNEKNKTLGRINLDSGCVFGEVLTAMDVRTRLKYTQKCLDRRVA